MGLIDKMLAEQRREDCEEMVLQAQDRLRRLAAAVRCFVCGSHIGDKRWVVVQHGEGQEVEHSSCYFKRTMEEEATQEQREAEQERLAQHSQEDKTGSFTFPAILKPGTADRGRQVHPVNAEVHSLSSVSARADNSDPECDDEGAGPLGYYERYRGDIAEIVRRHGRAL